MSCLWREGGGGAGAGLINKADRDWGRGIVCLVKRCSVSRILCTKKKRLWWKEIRGNLVWKDYSSEILTCIIAWLMYWYPLNLREITPPYPNFGNTLYWKGDVGVFPRYLETSTTPCPEGCTLTNEIKWLYFLPLETDLNPKFSHQGKCYLSLKCLTLQGEKTFLYCHLAPSTVRVLSLAQPIFSRNKRKFKITIN